ncbi:MAG: deoxyribodipyrimidine photo-lyase [Acidobacteriota bacterium]
MRGTSVRVTQATLVWLRQDLRLSDNPSLNAAMERGSPIVPVFIWSPQEEGNRPLGSASRWWLKQSLEQLNAALRKRGSRLVIRSGPVLDTLLTLSKETGANAIFWNRTYEPAAIARDRELKHTLRERGLTVNSFPGNLLFEPWTLANSTGQPFRVFTAFWKACLKSPAPASPSSAPDTILAPASWPNSEQDLDLDSDTKVDWAAGLRESWQPGEASALKQLTVFLDHAVVPYATERDRPDHPGTSLLSPYLHFGELSPRQIWHAAVGRPDAAAFLRQLVWREFAHHLLFHYPATPDQPLRSEFLHFPWRLDEASFKAWTRGQTGYPIVDAGMRQLWHTGWMHNRVRMVAASFLVKHLLIPWQEGAAWFWDTLVDADLANNTMGWQWVAGCGADAAPYFRIFNPTLQAERFDPDGAYVRRWVPELANLPNEWIHQPWNAPALVLQGAGVELGMTYPLPVVNHEFARDRALMLWRNRAQWSAANSYLPPISE